MVGLNEWSRNTDPCCLVQTYTFEVMLLKILNEMVCISCYVTNTKMKHRSQQEVIIIT